MYRLIYRRLARDHLALPPSKVKRALVDKLHELAADPDKLTADIDTLKGQLGYRLRVGRYRIIYTRREDKLTIEIVRIRSRGDIYKG